MIDGNKKWLIALFFVAMLVIANGCSANNVQSGSIESTDQNSSTIIVTDFAGRELTFDQPVERVASLVVGDLDIVHALGGEIVGRPSVQGEFYLTDLADVEQIGTTHEIDFEKIISVKPDLVIGNAGFNAKNISTAESLGIKMLLTDSKSFDAIIESIELYGQILNKEEKAQELIESLEAKKEEILATPLENELKVLVIYGTPDSLYAALPNSLSGSLLEMLGANNIADGLPKIENYPDYAQLSMERIVKANPDVIYFITHGNADAVKDKFESELKSNPSWESVNALKNDQLIFLPDDLFSSNPGTRVVEALQFLKDSLASLK